MAIIATESTELFSSDHTSSWLYPLWNRCFGPTSAERWASIHFLIRKAGHFTGYGLVSLAFYFSWSRSLQRDPRQRINKRLIDAGLSLLATFLIASADEIHQHFVPGRTSAFRDVLIDLLGASVALTLVLFLRVTTQNRAKPR